MSELERVHAGDKPGRRPRFGLVLLLLGAGLVLVAIASRHWLLQFVLLVVQAGALLLVLEAVDLSRRGLWGARTVVSVVALLALLGAALASGTMVDWLLGATTLLLVALGPPLIVTALRRIRAVTLEVVYSALALYLFVGLFFAILYELLSLLEGAFFAQNSAPSSLDFVYFSFVTLATLGYGDLTPATDLGKMLAVTETLLGQLYLVSVVAALVSRLGSRPR